MYSETGKSSLLRETVWDIPALTGLRGFAAVWVLVYHVWVESVPRKIFIDFSFLKIDLTPFFSIGWAGVIVFFVLSGFLLAYPFIHANERALPIPSRKGFLLRRIARVVPAYYFQLLVLILVFPLLFSGYAHPLDFYGVLKHAFMLFFPPYGVGPINGVWWTLPIEFSFYLLIFAIGPWIKSRWVWLFGLASVVLMVAWRLWIIDLSRRGGVQVGPITSYALPGSLDSFGMGVVACVVFERLKGSTPSFNVTFKLFPYFGIIGGVALLYWMHVSYLDYWGLSLIHFAWTLLFSICISMFILGLSFSNGILKWIFQSKIFYFVGVVSYGIYLWHFPIMEVLKRFFDVSGDSYVFPYYVTLVLFFSILAGYLSWRFVESPLIVLAKGLVPPKVMTDVRVEYKNAS